MPDTLLRTTLSATLLAFDEFHADLDRTGCDAPFAVCNQHILTVLTDHAASLRHLLSLRKSQQALAISDDAHDLLDLLLVHIAEIHESSDDAGCDRPYTVVNVGSLTQLFALRERIGSYLADWERDSAATKTSLRAALERSGVALRMIEAATGLVGDGDGCEIGENPEYERGVAELICNTCPIPLEHKNEILLEIQHQAVLKREARLKQTMAGA